MNLKEKWGNVKMSDNSKSTTNMSNKNKVSNLKENVKTAPPNIGISGVVPVKNIEFPPNSQPPSKPETKPKHYANLKGTVMGFDKYQNHTRPISPAVVYLKIDFNKKVYDLTQEKDIKELNEINRNILNSINTYEQESMINPFSPKEIGPDGIFEFKHLPVENWSYVVAAYVEDKEYSILDKNGYNGYKTNEAISNKYLLEKNNIEGIIVPVEDTWLIEAEPKKGDPKSDKDTKATGLFD